MVRLCLVLNALIAALAGCTALVDGSEPTSDATPLARVAQPELSAVRARALTSGMSSQLVGLEVAIDQKGSATPGQIRVTDRPATIRLGVVWSPEAHSAFYLRYRPGVENVRSAVTEASIAKAIGPDFDFASIEAALPALREQFMPNIARNPTQALDRHVNDLIDLAAIQHGYGLLPLRGRADAWFEVTDSAALADILRISGGHPGEELTNAQAFKIASLVMQSAMRGSAKTPQSNHPLARLFVQDGG